MKRDWRAMGKPWLAAIIGVALLTVLRLVLAQKMPLVMQGETSHDDFLMVRYAAYLAAGQWMGPFTLMVCVKGLSFPLFLAVNYLVGMPYALTLALCNVGAAAFFVHALKPWVKNGYGQLALYLFLIYSPVTFDTQISGMVYRNAILAPALLLVLGSAVGLYIRCGHSSRRLWPWSLGLGLSFAYFWNIREDTIWLLPFVVVALGITGITIWRAEGRAGTKKLGLLLLPLLCLGMVQVGQGMINKVVYGEYMINNRTGTAFGEMITQLIHVDDGQEDVAVWISKDMLKQAYAVSPTLAKMSGAIDEALEAWGSTPEDRGIAGDITVWALRDGLYRGGAFADATTLEKTCSQINAELSAAYADGRLQKRNSFYISGAARGMTAEDVPLLAENFKNGFLDIISYAQYACRLLPSTGPMERIRTMEVITNNLTLYPETGFNPDENIGATIQGEVGGLSQKIFSGVGSLYKASGTALALLAGVAWVVMLVQVIRGIRHQQLEDLPILLVITGLFLSSLVLLAGVVWFTSWMVGDYPYNIYNYTSPACTLMQVVEFLCLYWLGGQLKKKWVKAH